MNLITKNKPATLHHKLLEFSKEPDGTFKNLTKALKENLLDALLKEQNNTCAYCMIKINKDCATIEHIIGQNYKDKHGDKIGERNQLNYDNLLAVCEGKSCKKELHCDKSRSNFQQKNPLRELFVTPLSNKIIQNIKFSSKGLIYYENFTEAEEINELHNYENLSETENIKYDLEKVLNLNCENLKQRRENLVKALKKYTSNWSNKEKIKRKYDEYKSNPSNEFCQVALYHLGKYID